MKTLISLLSLSKKLCMPAKTLVWLSILGDNKYGNFNTNKIFKDNYHYENQFLHAEKLQFLNIEGILSYLSNKTFIAPLPDKEKKIIEEIRLKGRLWFFHVQYYY